MRKVSQPPTKSALERNLKARATSAKPSTTLTLFNQPPLLGMLFRKPGKAAKRAKGKPRATPNPAIPAVNGQAPPATDSTNKLPKMGPVQEKLTKARVRAMKKMPATPPVPSASLARLLQLCGRVSS